MAEYFITGVTGGLGASILKTLLDSGVAPKSIVVSSTRAEAASEFSPLGVGFVQISYENFEALKKAFAGVRNLFFVSTNTFNVQVRVKQHTNVIKAAKDAGVKHIWYSSLAFGGYGNSDVDVERAHIETEKLMAELLNGSETIWTSVREGCYADAFPFFVNWYPTDPNQVIYLPDDGGKGVAWASRAELGEGTAKLMMRGGYENRIALLSGPVAQRYQDIVDTINEVTGRNVTIKTVSPEEYVEYNGANDEGGKPKELFAAWVTALQGIAKGDAETVSPLLEELLGRKPLDGKKFYEIELRKNPNYTWHQNYWKNLQKPA